MSEATTPSHQDAWHCSYFCVGLLDFLGQRHALADIGKKWKQDPNDTVMHADIAKIAQTISTTRRLMRESAQIDNMHNSDNRSAPPSHIDALDRHNDIEFKVQSLSDATMLYARTSRDGRSLQLRGPRAIIVSLGIAIGSLLRIGRPARGSIELDLGWPLEESDLYGPAVSTAHELESKWSHWPRIIVGRELESWLHRYYNKSPASIEDQLNRVVAKFCLEELLIRSPDGWLMVDYLGPGFPDSTNMIGGIEGFAHDQIKLHAGKRDDVAVKYYLLLDYIRSCKRRWSS